MFDCYKRTKGELRENLHIDFVDYALFISFFPQLIAGPIVHHREMMPQFASMGNSSLGNHCADLLDFENSQTLQSSSLPKSSKNSTSTTTNTRIVESRNDEMEYTHSKNSPSFAEGVRGWVDSQKDNAQSIINYEYLAKGIFIFSIGLFKKVFIADSFAKWANAGFGVVEQGGVLNIAESWATSISYTFQLYFDFSGYCDMAMGLALMFGIVLPLNFDSPYKSLNITEFWRRWHITLGRFLRECLYIPLGGNRVGKILNLRNLFIVAFLSGIWHGAGWGFVIWGVLHGVAMMIHRIYSWILERLAKSIMRCHTERSEVSLQITQSRDSSLTSLRMTKLKSLKMTIKYYFLAMKKNQKFLRFTQTRLYKFLCWFITFNFINIAWVFFRSENLNGAVNLIKGMFGIVWVELPQKLHRMPEVLAQIGGRNDTIFYIIIAFIVCLACKNSFEMLKNFDTQYLRFRLALRIFNKKIYLKGGAVFTRFVLTIALFYIAIWAMLSNLLDSNAYTPFLYFNF
nr:MBOAT family O-acyltransferase [Helicobacter macacae]